MELVECIQLLEVYLKVLNLLTKSRTCNVACLTCNWCLWQELYKYKSSVSLSIHIANRCAEQGAPLMQETKDSKNGRPTRVSHLLIIAVSVTKMGTHASWHYTRAYVHTIDLPVNQGIIGNRKRLKMFAVFRWCILFCGEHEIVS